MLSNVNVPPEAYVEIVEQPASNAFRFRYESEGRLHGSIPGANSTQTNKTFPKIRIIGPYRHGRVIVSCVTEDDCRAHPHRVVSKQPGAYVGHGVFIVPLNPNSNEVEFKNLGIQCVTRKKIRESLEKRREIGVDPFRMGYDPDEISGEDLNSVRLCFQVYVRPLGDCSERTEIGLKPVVSDPIHDRQSFPDLVISRLSSAVASLAGGTSLIIFCQKVIKDDIKVRFFEELNDQVVWETFGKFQPKDVYDQTAIFLSTPPYYNQNVDHPIDIFVQLIRPSTNESGKPVPLELLPPPSICNMVSDEEAEISLKRKREVIKITDISNHPNNAPCGCILGPIIDPDCPIHNPQPGNSNQRPNLMDNEPVFEAMGNSPQERSKLFYYDRNITTKGAMSLPKHAENLMPPTHHAVHSSASNVPQIPPNAFNIPTQCAYTYIPALAPSYEPLPSPHRPQCMYQSPFPRNTTPFVPDVPAVPFNNQRDWQVQPEPTLQPIIVQSNEQQTQPSNNYDYNWRDPIDTSQNLLEFSINNEVNQLSDSLTTGLNLDERLEEFNTYDMDPNNGYDMNMAGIYEDNAYAVQGILNVSQNQQPQNQPDYLTGEWTWDSKLN